MKKGPSSRDAALLRQLLRMFYELRDLSVQKCSETSDLSLSLLGAADLLECLRRDSEDGERAGDLIIITFLDRRIVILVILGFTFVDPEGR